MSWSRRRLAAADISVSLGMFKMFRMFKTPLPHLVLNILNILNTP
jgi:hypothetical protein